MPTQRLSARAVLEILIRLQRDCFATIASTAAQAVEHGVQGGERRLIGVATNFQPQQLRVASGRKLLHPFYDDVFFGIRARADSGDLDLLLLTELAQRVTGQPNHYVEICQRHEAAGVILIAFEPYDRELELIADSGLPYITIDTHVIGSRASFATSDNVGGAVAAVRHLGAQGRTRIAFVGGADGTVASNNRRLGYESGLEELGLEQRDEFVLETDWRPLTAYERARALLESSRPPDAFFCASDELALGVMLAIEKTGRTVPDDVAVVGFDDADFAQYVTPSLSSVRQDRVGLGAASVEALVRMLDAPAAPSPVSMLPVELVVRESSSSRLTAREGEALGESEESGARELVEPRSQLSVADALSMLTSSDDSPPEDTDAYGSGRAAADGADERRLIAVVIGTSPNQSFPRGFFHTLFLAIRAQAHARGIDLLLVSSIDAVHGSPHETFVEHYRQLGVQALIVLSQPENERELVALAEAGYPCVTVGIDLLGDRVAFIMSDNIDGTVQAVDHLIEFGRKRIAFIGGRSDVRATIDRHFSYQSELKRMGLECPEEYVAMAHWQPELAREEMKRMLSLGEPPDAVFCNSDVMAIAAMAAIEEAGLRIPDDVAVVGFDDIEYAGLVTPTLTTVRQDQAKMAHAIMEAALHLLDHPNEAPTVSVLPVELIVRESSAPS
jgi:DNA-binding LacI/PurR family transcriptional regulator